MSLVTPGELARRLGLPEPTPEQAEVIAAPPAPMAVVAGAGSGKSETMAARVVWLVANGLARPERVLGLTFTRKAAAELASRIRRRLDQLREHDDLVAVEILDGEPTVSTYHAYAARLFADHALREALEPTMRLITPAVSWQLAARVVDSYDGPMDQVDWTPDTVTKAVIELAGQLAEHLRTPDDVRQIGEWLRASHAEVRRHTQQTRGPLARQQTRERLLPLVEAYTAAKLDREVIDYGDQMALAARIAAGHPEVGAIERSRYAVVLLDEYQDTSHAQLVLLRALFGGGHPVTAVGDPCQSIYGWRGASAGNLLRFVHDFPFGDAPAPMRQLSVSFRNGELILDAAARVQQELRAEARAVPRLYSGPNRAGRGRVECALFATAREEAERIAGRIAHLLRRAAARPGHGDPVVDLAPDGYGWPEGSPPVTRHGSGLQPADVAVLARKRSQFPLIRKALEARGIPVEVVGLGGLLTVPEVQDVVATLKVMYDPTAGASLARLLTGPRWRMGPRDLVALGRRARELARQAARDVALPDSADRALVPVAVAQDYDDPLRRTVQELAEESGSLVDALDDLGSAEAYSAEGYQRLCRLQGELRVLRTHLGLPLPDLITEVERVLGLDIEVGSRSGLDPVTARADLDAFVDAAARFAGDAEDPTLSAFLAFLKAAEDEEHGLEAGRVGETNSVKLLTVHAAKGLEWPVVVVPGLSSIAQKDGAPAKGSVFPARPQGSTRWTENPRVLPYPLRGDSGDLPRLAGLEKADLAEFDERCRDRDLREERRLAYVAVTRAAYLLIATGYWWGSASRPLGPSPFLTEIREACLAGAGSVAEWADPPAEGATNPLHEEPESASWPAVPAGEGHAAVAEGAQMVSDAITGQVRSWPTAGYPALRPRERARMSAWARDVELLLAERDAARRGDGLVVELPAHLSVSSLVVLARDASALARQIRRPIPREPAPYARRGTAFHRWLESRWGQQRLLDPDDLPGAADEGAADDAQLARLQERFEDSSWAARDPVEVEVSFETVIGDRLIRGRMDAVFRTASGGFEVVDWKTGAMPLAEEARYVAVQLAAYRLAWAQLAGVPVERVSAAFHYVAADITVRPADLLGADDLIALLDDIPTVV